MGIPPKHLRPGPEAQSADWPETSPMGGPASAGFWEYLDWLVANSRVVIDRPQGSAHPRYPSLIYPLDYGFLEATRAMDGGGIDLWVGSLPERRLDAVIMTVDLTKRDTEIKLLLGCTEAEKQIILDFLNDFSMRAHLVRREPSLAHLHGRRSVRRFLPQAVPEDILRQVLEAGTWAPSAHNRQPWRFAVLRTLQARLRLAEAMGLDFHRDLTADGVSPEEAAAQVERSRRRLEEAPVVILLCLDPTQGDTYPDPARQQAEFIMATQGLAMAAENMLLAAHALGLGGVWVCAPLFASETARLVLDLPPEWQPQGMLMLGYPAKIPPPRPRRPLDEVTRYF